MSDIPKKPYTEIPTFVVDEGWSAHEGETMHRVGRLPRGDYYVDIAVTLVADLVIQFLKNAEAAGFSREEIMTQFDEAVRSPKGHSQHATGPKP